MKRKAMQEYRKDLLDKLPPIVTRKQALEAVGNLYSPRTLSNMESRREGPKAKIKIGRQVAYEREVFVDFIMNKIQHTSPGRQSA